MYIFLVVVIVRDSLLKLAFSTYCLLVVIHTTTLRLSEPNN